MSVAASAAPVNVVTQVVSNPPILQGVQIVNVNPVRAGIPSTGQKTLAPRVVIGGNQVRIATAGPQIIGGRPGLPGAHGPIQVRLLPLSAALFYFRSFRKFGN